MNRLSCRLARKRLVEYFYGELSGEGARRIAGHLEACGDCRELLEGMKSAAEAVRCLPSPEPPASFWNSYTQRVVARISERKPVRGPRAFPLPARVMVSAAALVMVVAVSWAGARSYWVQKEIANNRELYQNVETIWNLSMLDDMIEGHTVFSETLDQAGPVDLQPHSRAEIRRRFSKFRKLPAPERDVILANYQRWNGYSAAEKVEHKRVFHLLKRAEDPHLKRLN